MMSLGDLEISFPLFVGATQNDKIVIKSFIHVIKSPTVSESSTDISSH